MTDSREVVQSLRQGATEITELRRRLEITEAFNDGVRAALLLVRAVPSPDRPIGMGEDIAWKMRHVASELEIITEQEALRRAK